MAAKRILIDPGHGGNDPGATGNGIKEKDINLAICRLLPDLLKPRGIEVVLTRTSDVSMSLSARTDMAVAKKVDAVLSRHSNAGGGKGTETYRSVFNAESGRLAAAVHGQLIAAFPEFANRGIKTRLYPGRSDWDYYHMIREPHRQAGIPAIITENGFIDHVGDAAVLKRADFAAREAEALARGICAYFGVSWSKQEAAPDPETLYRVQIGAFAVRANAEACLKKAQAAGFKDAFIVEPADGSSPAPVPVPEPKHAPKPEPSLKVGSKVRVKKGAKDYNGTQLASFVYSTVYDVIQISGDRVVIGLGKAVTAAVHKKDLILV